MALLSPGIQIFESSVTPAATIAPAENGVATLGFAKKGPVNKLTRIRSVSEFAEVFGDPIDPQYYAHIMAQSVLANGTDVYFMRLGDPNTLAEAKCPVVADFPIEGAKEALKDTTTNLVTGYLAALWDPSETSPASDVESGLKARVTINVEGSDTLRYAYADAHLSSKFGDINSDGAHNKVIYTSLLEISEALTKAAGDLYSFSIVNNDANGEVGILVSTKNETSFNASSAAELSISFSFGYLDGTNVWSYITGSESGVMPSGEEVAAGKGTVTNTIDVLFPVIPMI